jgi:RHS repeat-associated protein
VQSQGLTATVTQRYTLPISWSIGYDNRDRVTSFNRLFSGSGQQAASGESFTYDPNSNRLSSVNIAARDNDKDDLYETSEQRSNTARILSIQPSSNKLQGFTQTVVSLTGANTTSNVTSQINYTLDANGNLTSDGLRQFQYDASDRLSKVILGTTFVSTDSIAGNELAQHSYLYNAAGQRVFKSEPKTETTAPDSTTLGSGFVSWLQTNFSWLWATAQTNATLGDSYLYADGQLPSWALLGQYGNGGASSTGRTEYIWLPTGNGNAIPVGMYRSGQLHAIHTDHLGTPRLMVDRNNTPVWQWAYSAFGDNAPTGILKPTTNAASAFVSMPAGSNGNVSATMLATSNPTQVNNLRFPGQYADSETGFFYNYFRSYQPNQGRYTQNDPIGLAGGWNRYQYVEGNPLTYTDPLGLWAIGDPLPQGAVDFSAGLGDALLLGTGGTLRALAGIGGVDVCSDEYDYGSYAALGAGGARLAYAGLAKVGSVLASSGAQASGFRAGLKTFFRGGVGGGWRPPNLAGKTDAQLRASAGKTNLGMNAYGGGVGAAGAIGAAQCGCRK